MRGQVKTLPTLAEMRAKPSAPPKHQAEPPRRPPHKLRAYIFAREGGLCRCCRHRKAESLHELQPRSLGGVPSPENSIAVCGTIVGAAPSCHTYLQLHQIRWIASQPWIGEGAEGGLIFEPLTDEARRWMSGDARR